jgi:N-acetylglutamate synthase-like GNAT family acetyltransferase
VGPVSIRTATLEDLAALREIFRSASLANDGDRANLLRHPEFLELGDQAIVEQRLRVAEVDGRPVGFATTTSPSGSVVELDDLFVHPDRMRRGVATRLVADAVERAQLAGVSRIEVTANPHATAFYRSVGFEELGPVETALGPGVRMALVIGGVPAGR